MRKIIITPDIASLGKQAAELFVEKVNAAIADHGNAFVALSGGSTPKILYNELQHFQKKVHWQKVKFFWSDERTVPLNHPDSNMHMALEHLLHPLAVKNENIFLLHVDAAPEQAAAEYQATIRATVPIVDGLPKFDLILLGMGSDGHTASLFPQTEALQEQQKLVTSNWVEKLQTWRLTFTFPLINHANTVLFLVAGADKQQRVQEILQQNDQNHPAAKIDNKNGTTIWMLDNAAAQLI